MKTLTESGVRWLWSCRRIVFTALLLLATVLVACDEGSMTSRPEIRLTVDKSSVLSGDKVTLTAEVIKGPVTSVTFKRDKGEPITPITTPDEQGNFVAEVAVTEKTVFTAQAKGAGGTAAQSKAVTVDITAPPQAVAVDQTFITYREIPLFYGVTPTDFAATSEVKVEGIVGSVQAETDKATAKGGSVTIQAGENALAFSYTPPTNRFTGLDTFEYLVKSGEQTEPGTITVDVKGLDPKISVVSSLSDIAGLPEAQTIVLNKQLFCNQNPCVRLKNNQTLTGTVTTTDGVTLNGPGAGILANIPGTRQPGTPACRFLPQPVNCSETVVIELADNVTIQNVEIAGEGQGYFVGLRSKSDSNSANTLSGRITVKDVVMKGSSGKPIYIVYGEGTNYGNYNLVIDNLDILDANDTVVIGNPARLEFKNSFIELVKPFGDNVGINIDNTVDGEIIIDGLEINMESTEYKLDIDSPGFNASPFIIESRGSAATKLTVKNTDITIEDIAASDVFSFRIRAYDSSTTEILDVLDGEKNTAPRGVQYDNPNSSSDTGTVEGRIQFN
jgi:hypothetical protein